MKRNFFLLLFIVLFNMDALSQDYVTAIGLRGGTSLGVNLKYFLSISSSLETIVATRDRGYYITGLYAIQNRAFRVRHLYWFAGGGAHAGYWEYYDGIQWLDEGVNAVVAGIDGIVGMEYNIMEIPLTMSLDLKPALNFIGTTKPWFETAISLRYRIN